MKSIKIMLLAMLCCFFSNALFSQSETPMYYSWHYMMVSPGDHGDYLACEKAWKKIHAYNKKLGKIEDWALMQIMSPSGTSVPYNYVTRTRFKDLKQLAAYQDNSYMPEDLSTILTPDELALVNRTGKLRDYVKSEICSSVERVLDENMDEATIAVVNYFKMPKGVTRAEHFKMERDLWMPFHKQGVEKGNIKGWVLLNRMLPMGSSYDYDILTVDLYKNMDHFWQPFDEEGFKKLNNGKSAAEVMSSTDAAGTRNRVEIRKSIDGL